MNIYRVFQSRFPTAATAPFIETTDGRLFTYADLERESARLAAWMTALGAKPGDRIAVQVDKSAQVMFLYLACLRAGFVYLPLNTAYTDNELAYFLDDARPALFVCRPEVLDAARRLAQSHAVPHVYSLGTKADGTLMASATSTAPDFTTVESDDNDTAVILYTSGTTGRPKGAMITHKNLRANGLALHDVWHWQPGDILLHALPVFHIHGLFVACHCALLNGSKVIFLDKFDVATVIRLLPKATVFMGVPTYYVRLLASPAFTADVCSGMRLFTCGSAPLLEQTFEEFRARTGHTIVERYGMTETGMNTSNPIDGPCRAGTVGPPLPGVSVRVVDEHLNDLPAGEIGQLLVKGDNVFKGYWQMPDKTAAEFTADGYFRTGDLARRDDDGYVAIVGRGKDLIITGGLNVYPKEIEFEIDQIEGVVESAVIGVPHPDFGEAVTAVVVRHPKSRQLDAPRIISHLKTRLANFKVPKAVHFVDVLPRNTMGKVQKNELRQRYGVSG